MRGAGFLEVVQDLRVPARVACDVTATLAEAPRLFGPQKGAGPEEIAELERRFAAKLARSNTSPGGGAAGGLGAALASLGAELVPGAALVLDAIGFDPSGYDLVVTGEGRVDATTALGKAPGEVARRSLGGNALHRLRRSGGASRCRAWRRSRSRAIRPGRTTI